MQRLKAFLVLIALAVGLTACGASSSGSDPNTSESKIRDGSYKTLVHEEPAHTMTYPVTRKTINFWIDTWNKPGQLAYTYLQNANGKITGYYVLVGPPVSMCAALTPTQQINWDTNGNVITNAPSVDGVFYSGGQCNQYYGKDAASGAYIEFSVGLGINVLLYTQPLSPAQIGDAQNLAPKK